jgi:toxin secretion/phage lysis holin
MSNVEFTFRGIVAVIGSAIAWFFGGWDTAIIALITMITIDYVTGVVAAIINKQLSSAVGFKGLAKKGCILLIVGMGATVDKLTGKPIVESALTIYYIVNEGISILENMGRIGVPYPDWLKNVIMALNSGSKVPAPITLPETDETQDNSTMYVKGQDE